MDAIQVNRVMVNRKIGVKIRYRAVREVSNHHEYRLKPLSPWFASLEKAHAAMGDKK
jgi:hypothetical protein